MESRIYGCKEAGLVEEGTYGWFGDSEAAVKNAMETSPIMRLSGIDLHDGVACRFGRSDGKRYSMFFPVCRECNLAAYDAYRKGKAIKGGKRSYVAPYIDEVDRVEFPDFLNDTLTVKEG